MISQQPMKNANFASGDLSKDRKSSETSARNRVKIDAMVRYSARGGVCEAESNIELPALVSTPAAADWDASVRDMSVANPLWGAPRIGDR